MIYSINRLTHQSESGSGGESIADPLQHLVACHERIEERLQTLERAVPHLGSEFQERRDEARRALDNALEFLKRMGTLHTQDEEESLFPRLVAKGGDDAGMISELLTMLETQHREKEEVLQKLLAGVAQLSEEAAVPSEAQIARLEGYVAHLADLYRPHIMIENQRLIPLSADHLERSDPDEILQEMRGRRSE